MEMQPRQGDRVALQWPKTAERYEGTVVAVGDDRPAETWYVIVAWDEDVEAGVYLGTTSRIGDAGTYFRKGWMHVVPRRKRR